MSVSLASIRDQDRAVAAQIHAAADQVETFTATSEARERLQAVLRSFHERLHADLFDVSLALNLAAEDLTFAAAELSGPLELPREELLGVVAPNQPDSRITTSMTEAADPVAASRAAISATMAACSPVERHEDYPAEADPFPSAGREVEVLAVEPLAGDRGEDVIDLGADPRPHQDSDMPESAMMDDSPAARPAAFPCAKCDPPAGVGVGMCIGLAGDCPGFRDGTPSALGISPAAAPLPAGVRMRVYADEYKRRIKAVSAWLASGEKSPGSELKNARHNLRVALASLAAVDCPRLKPATRQHAAAVQAAAEAWLAGEGQAP